MAYQAGQKLGNYQLVRFLGHGGFAEVYLGKHIYLNTQAAIKVLQRQSNNETLERFLQEARIIAALKHPHIVGVLEFGIEEQRPYLVMAYAPHGTLRQRYGRGNALSPVVILPFIRQVAEALYYAHERKIIHRDVKPENMLLDGNNTVLLSDFGLALREHSTYHSVHSTDSAGTTIYMSPEQLKGKPCAASDQYALGVVMYEWLCGCLPFDGPDISVVVQHLHEPPVPLREHVPTLPTEIEAVVLRALEKDPKQRFATVQELAEAFEEACKGISMPENAVPVIDAVQYGDVSLPAELVESQEATGGELIKLLPDSDQGKISLGMMPGVAWPSHYSSLQAPSLSASLNMSSQDTNADTSKSQEVVNISLISAQKGARISRRTALVGIAGIGVILGGVGIWRFSSGGVRSLPLNVQAIKRGSGLATPAATSNRRISGKSSNGSPPGMGGPAPSPVIGKNNGVTNPVTAGKGAGTSTPSTSSSRTPVATSTPGGSSGVTPVATSTSSTSSTPQATVLTVRISNPPASVQNRTTTDISIMTNRGAISFQFEADYFGLKNAHKSVSPDSINGTTDGSGAAIVSWYPTLPPGQVVSGTYADLHVVATGQNGNTVSAQSVQVEIT
jgi:serine/threonine protein kinase